MFVDRPELDHWMRWHGVEPEPAPEHLSHDPRLAAHGCLSDQTLFRALGFDEVLSVDISDYEGSEIIADLNQEIPPELEGRFDAVFDGGTMQHIFDVPQVLRNLHRTLKPGGRLVFSAVPVNNHVDHGCYILSPTLFVDYFRANNY